MSPQPIVHIEFASKDPAQSARFYEALFGWKIVVAPEFNYYMFDAQTVPPQQGGGFPQVGMGNIQEGEVIVYVQSDDIEATLARAEALGGKTETPKTEIPGQGWFAFIKDPSGTRVALYTSANQSPG